MSERDHRVSLAITVLIICLPLLLCLRGPLDSLYLQLQFKSHIPVCMHGNVSFSPLQFPLLASPRPLPAIYRANLKLHYYDSCTRCVGGRFRTSTPSINPPMGPTSWLNRPVPVPDNLSSNEAKLRSCDYSQNFLLSVSPLAKKNPLLTPFQYFFEASASQLKTAPLPKALQLFGFLATDGFDFAADCFSYCFGHYFCWKNKLCIVHYKCFPFCFMWFTEVAH